MPVHGLFSEAWLEAGPTKGALVEFLKNDISTSFWSQCYEISNKLQERAVKQQKCIKNSTICY